jgi:hypothetical protein
MSDRGYPLWAGANGCCPSARLAHAGEAWPGLHDLAALHRQPAGGGRAGDHRALLSGRRLRQCDRALFAHRGRSCGRCACCRLALSTGWAPTTSGRDIFSRIVYGSRITLFVVILVAVLAAPIGLLIGTVAGYAGGWVDAVLMRITDIFLAFPKLILALAFVAALGPGIENAVIAIAITSWPPYARIARAETLTVRNSDYIAGRAPDGRLAGPHRASPHHAALPLVADRARDARHGRHHPHRRRASASSASARSRPCRNGAR